MYSFSHASDSVVLKDRLTGLYHTTSGRVHANMGLCSQKGEKGPTGAGRRKRAHANTGRGRRSGFHQGDASVPTPHPRRSRPYTRGTFVLDTSHRDWLYSIHT